MGHTKMWKWICIITPWLFLVMAFVLVNHTETRLDPLSRRTVHQVDGLSRSDETRERSSVLQMVGQVGGRTEDVAVQGDYAYVAVGLRLVVLDVSEPITPTEIGSTSPVSQFVEGVAINGTEVYLAVGTTGLRVVDVSDPTDPVEVGAYDTPGYAEGVAVVSQYAYVADGHYGLRIVDISDPTRPTETAYAYPLNYVFDVAVDGQYAYLAAAGAGLLVVNVSDPAHPVELGTRDTPGYAYGIDVVGDMAFIADGWEDLYVVDVSDPTHPTVVGSYNTPGWAFGVDVVGNRAYVADASGGLRVLDVSDPTNLAELGSYAVSGGHAGSVVVVGSTAYVTDRNWGLRIVDVSDANAPAQIGFYGPFGYADAVAISGDYAYVAAAAYGLRVVDISNPAHPREIAAYDTQSPANGVVVIGNYAYVITIPGLLDAGLHIVDISEPMHPTRASFHRVEEGVPQDIVVAGGIAYVADEWGLQLISVSDPVSPTQLSFLGFAGGPGNCTWGVAVSDTLAYVAKEWEGLKIIDVSNPYSPSLVGGYESPTLFALGVAVAGNFAYVANGSRLPGGLQVVDASRPTDPIGVGFYETTGQAERVAFANGTAYIADGSAGLVMVDVSNPFTPTLAGFYRLPGYANEVAVSDSYVYVANGSGGLFIVEQSYDHFIHDPGEFEQPADSDELTYDLDLVSNTPTAWFENTRESGTYIRQVSAAARTPIRAPSPPVGFIREVSSSGQGSQWSEVPDHGPYVRRVSPRVAGVCTVTNSADSGPGTLRECLSNAVTGDIITFNPTIFPPTSPVTISLTSQLPPLAQDNLTVNASDAGVILDGRGTPLDTEGLNINSNGNVVRGLHVINFPGIGVRITGSGNTIGGDRTIGSGPAGQGNIISGNGAFGLGVCDSSAMSNTIIGNFIGTDAAGLTALGNAWDGVGIWGEAKYNRVGGTMPGERNVISGNGKAGVFIGGVGTMHNTVIGNFIGTDATGRVTLGNAGAGVMVCCEAKYTRIGGTLTSERNIISGNGREEVRLMGAGTANNIVVGDYIGTDVDGTASLGNAFYGVAIDLGAFANRIEGNVISGGGGPGRCHVLIQDWGSSYNEVIGNFIGADASGTVALGNGGVGVGLGVSFNRLGGTTPEERNIISGDLGWGVLVGNTGGWTDMFVIGNYVGTNVIGTRAIGNIINGVGLSEGTHHSFVGGTTEGEGNLISGNGSGLLLNGPAVEHNFIAGNYIGTDASGIVAIPNQNYSVAILNTEHNTLQSNLISGNAGGGVLVEGDSNFLRANRIGTTADGAGPLPNGAVGVRIESALNTVGGRYPEDGNVISFNNGNGIQVWTYSSNTIRRNSIFGNSNSGIHLGNGGNNSLAAPVITEVLTRSISGKACPGCIVEVFSDEEDEGRIYEGYAIADGSGNWTWTGSLSGPYVTATATDGAGNTSAFSAPQGVWRGWIYLPLIMREQ
jgi:parallel beta-helix repeat protein